MALNFTGGTTNKVNCGSDSSLDGIGSAGTYLWWMQDHEQDAFRVYLNKNADFGLENNTTLSGAFRLSITRSTSPLIIQPLKANFAVYGTSKWLFHVVVWDTAGAVGDQKMFLGDLTTLAAEPSGYNTRQVGSGTPSANIDPDDLIIGNNLSGSFAFDGLCAWAMLCNAALSDAQIKSLQFSPRAVSSTVGMWPLGLTGTGTQPDWSGNANNGTVTGATQTAHVPLPLFPYRIWMPQPAAPPVDLDINVAVDNPDYLIQGVKVS